MKTAALTRIIPIIAVVISFSRLVYAEGPAPAGSFDKANHEFADRNFKDAIANYEAVVTSGEWSANLFYNLANAYYRERDFGRAILNYERALRIDPHHPEAEANLELTREDTHALQMPPTLAERFLGPINPSFLAIVAAISFWLAVILLIFRIRTSTVLAAVVCLILCVACVLAIYSVERGVQGSLGAIVVKQNSEARVATADSAQSILALPPGSEVLVLQPRGDWSYVALPNNQHGWVPSDSVAQIRL